MHIKLKRNKIFWHYNLVSRNGQIISTSENYFSKGNCRRAATRLSKALKVKIL